MFDKRGLTPEGILDREFLEIRSQLISVGASLDRFERSGGDLSDDRRSQLLLEAVKILQDGQDDRANRIQMLFSRPYDQNWNKS
ncbi:MAG: hypothetical protein R3C03_20905 [Pirellulaceae bacterium]